MDDTAVALRALEDNLMIPCGHTKTVNGDVHNLNETTRRRTARFTIGGVWYSPGRFMCRVAVRATSSG
jgi:hypothetical protein